MYTSGRSEQAYSSCEVLGVMGELDVSYGAPREPEHLTAGQQGNGIEDMHTPISETGGQEGACKAQQKAEIPMRSHLHAWYFGTSQLQDTCRIIGQALHSSTGEYPAHEELGLLVVPHLQQPAVTAHGKLWLLRMACNGSHCFLGLFHDFFKVCPICRNTEHCCIRG